MGELRKLLFLLVMFVCGFGMVVGCGGGEAPGEPQTTAKQERLYPWLKGPSREFLIRNGDNAVPTFGQEATKAEREEASRLIAAWMRARAAQNWKKDCSYFSRHYLHTLIAADAVKVSQGKVKNCAQGLAYFGHEASGSYKNNLTGPIDSLRVRENQGFAQYHGNDGHDWVIPLEREGGRWLIANSTPIGRSS
jgi:hypothetical protein